MSRTRLDSDRVQVSPMNKKSSPYPSGQVPDGYRVPVPEFSSLSLIDKYLYSTCQLTMHVCLQGLEILRVSLQSKTVLSDVFLGKKKQNVWGASDPWYSRRNNRRALASYSGCLSPFVILLCSAVPLSCSRALCYLVYWVSRINWRLGYDGILLSLFCCIIHVWQVIIIQVDHQLYKWDQIDSITMLI
jgi:hypothetical protein